MRRIKPQSYVPNEAHPTKTDFLPPLLIYVVFTDAGPIQPGIE